MRAERRGSIAVCATLLAVTCVGPGLPSAVGSFSDITILADHDRAAVGTLRTTLSQPVTLAGEPEPLFDVETLFDFDARARTARTLVVVATIDGASPASRCSRRLLGEARCEALRARGAGRFEMVDVYARGQQVIVVAAVRDRGVDSLAAADAAAMRDDIERSALGRCRSELLAADAGEPRAAELWSAHGFTLRVPATYATQPASGTWPNAVELLRSAPTRALTVFWIDGADSAQATDADFAAGLQRDVLWRLHGDTLVEELTRIDTLPWGPFEALRLRGVWQNSSDIGGGPLVTFLVHDSRRQRLYGVQCQLYAPGIPKRGWMRELEALASTFRIAEGG